MHKRITLFAAAGFLCEASKYATSVFRISLRGLASSSVLSGEAQVVDTVEGVGMRTRCCVPIFDQSR